MAEDLTKIEAMPETLRERIQRSGEKKDKFGAEMDDDARVFRVYGQAAQKHDTEKLSQWNGSLDTLLIFAGLFSAVSTAFIIESYTQMQPDYTELTYRLLLANLSGQAFEDPPFEVSETSRAINCLWISSLIMSLFTSLIAILAKQWLASYPLQPRENWREWSQIRHFRFESLNVWRVPAIIAIAPSIIHLSLMLFLAGLVLFLWDLDRGTMFLAMALSALTLGVYVFITFSPALWTTSPFRTPLTPVLREMVLLLFRSSALPYIVRRWRKSGAAAAIVSRLRLWKTVLGKGWAAVCSVSRLAVQGLGTRDSHSFTDPWTTQTEFSPPTIAACLSWLGTSAGTFEMYNAVVDALGDADRGPLVCPLVAQGVKERIQSEIDTLARAPASRPGLRSDQSRHFRAGFHCADIDMLALILPLSTWADDSELRTEFADTIIRARCYTLERRGRMRDNSRMYLGEEVSTPRHPDWAIRNLSDWQKLCDHPSILESTAVIAIRWFSQRVSDETRSREVMESSRLHFFRERVVTMVNAFQPHITAAADVIDFKTLSDLTLDDEMPRYAVESTSRWSPGCQVGGARCDLLAYIASVASRHRFDLSSSDGRRFRARTFDSLVWACTLHSGEERHWVIHSSIREFILAEVPLADIPLTSHHVSALLQSWGDSEDAFAMLQKVLHPHHDWHIPGTGDPMQRRALDVCCDLAYRLIDSRNYYAVHRAEDTLRPLLQDACLEPLSRASTWHNRDLISITVELLLSWITTARGPSSIRTQRPVPSSGLRHRSPAPDGTRGPDAVDLLTNFFREDAQCGTKGPAVVRTWDLAVTAPQQILFYANSTGDTQRNPARLLDDLCTGLCKLRRLFPDLRCWLQIAQVVREKSGGYLHSKEWAKADRTRERVQSILLSFLDEMSSGPIPASPSADVQDVFLSWLRDFGGLGYDKDPPASAPVAVPLPVAEDAAALEWQVDGAY